MSIILIVNRLRNTEKECGVFLCLRMYSEEFGDKYQDYEINGAPSVLTIYGYSARKDGPDLLQRRQIIEYLIENEIAQKYELKEILSNLIIEESKDIQRHHLNGEKT